MNIFISDFVVVAQTWRGRQLNTHLKFLAYVNGNHHQEKQILIMKKAQCLVLHVLGVWKTPQVFPQHQKNASAPWLPAGQDWIKNKTTTFMHQSTLFWLRSKTIWNGGWCMQYNNICLLSEPLLQDFFWRKKLITISKHSVKHLQHISVLFSLRLILVNEPTLPIFAQQIFKAWYKEICKLSRSTILCQYTQTT